jgi:hypothetical protein
MRAMASRRHAESGVADARQVAHRRLTPPLGTSTIRHFYRHAKSQAPKAVSPCFDSDFRQNFYRQAENWCDGKFSAASWRQIFTVRFTVKLVLVLSLDESSSQNGILFPVISLNRTFQAVDDVSRTVDRDL